MIKNSNYFLYWWLNTSIIVLAASIIQYYGMWETLWNADTTKLSFIILGIFLLNQLYIGIKYYHRYIKQKITSISNLSWYSCDVMINLGLIGTVIGFIFMLVGPFTEIDVEQLETVVEAIKTIAEGMGIALLTTLVGISCSIITRFQIIQFDNDE